MAHQYYDHLTEQQEDADNAFESEFEDKVSVINTLYSNIKDIAEEEMVKEDYTKLVKLVVSFAVKLGFEMCDKYNQDIPHKAKHEPNHILSYEVLMAIIETEKE